MKQCPGIALCSFGSSKESTRHNYVGSLLPRSCLNLVPTHNFVYLTYVLGNGPYALNIDHFEYALHFKLYDIKNEHRHL